MTLTSIDRQATPRVIGTASALLLFAMLLFTAPLQAVPPAAPALWKLTDADSEIWLFGTVHMLDPTLSWHSEKVNAAFNDAEIVVLEADVLDTPPANMQLILQKYARNPEGVRLSSLLSAEGNDRFIKAVISFGKTEAEARAIKLQFEPLRPWLVGLQLANMQIQSRGADASAGVETILTEAAKDERKTMRFLETIEQQIEVFADLSQEQQTRMLELSLIQWLEEPDMLDKIVAAWLIGDVEQVGAMLQSAIKDPAIYEALFTNRNQDWARQLKEAMDGSGRYFVAVGAGHLTGKGSVQDYLRANGLSPVRIQ